MKKNIAVAAVLILCGTAGAQTTTNNIISQLAGNESLLGKRNPRLRVDLDTRVDLRYSEGNEPEYSNFNLQNMRLVVTGEIAPGIRFRWRQRINRPTTPNPDGSGAATDHIWVAFDVGHKKNWTLTVGKQFVQLGTYEFYYNGADTYLNTQVNGDFVNTRIGVNAAYRFLGQTLNFQLMNSGDQMTDSNYSTRGLGAAIMWAGKLFDGIIGTRIGYAGFQHNSSKIYPWFTAGLQINTGAVTTELDFYQGDRILDYSPVVEGYDGRHHVRDMSGAVNVALHLGKWRPAIKGILDHRRDMELKADAYENMGIQALLEFYPFPPDGVLKDLRFHAVYSYMRTNFEGAFRSMKDKNVNTVLVGMRWIIPIL